MLSQASKQLLVQSQQWIDRREQCVRAVQRHHNEVFEQLTASWEHLSKNTLLKTKLQTLLEKRFGRK